MGVEAASGGSGRSIAFLSAKGGTGKTIFSASLAEALMYAGYPVVTIDTDFSTRGMSFYLLGDLVKYEGLHIAEENCLADSFLGDVSPSEVEPLLIPRDGLDYRLILSNADVVHAGRPDDRMVDGAFDNQRYYHYLKAMCRRLQEQGYYVILDTRGGYDPPSAIPGLVSDGYVLVVEADEVNADQVWGLRGVMGSLAEKLDTRDPYRGFIVNKAIDARDRQTHIRVFESIIRGQGFGYVPFDLSAAFAYKEKQIPRRKDPSSPFSYWSLSAFSEALAVRADVEREGPVGDRARAFTRLLSEAHLGWRRGQRVEEWRGRAPALLTVLLLMAMAGYGVYLAAPTPANLAVFFVPLAGFVLGASALVGGGLLDRLKAHMRPLGRAAILLVVSALFWGLLVDAPQRFSASNDVLIQQARALTVEVAELEADTFGLGRRIIAAQDTIAFMASQAALIDSVRTLLVSDNRDLRDRVSLDAARIDSLGGLVPRWGGALRFGSNETHRAPSAGIVDVWVEGQSDNSNFRIRVTHSPLRGEQRQLLDEVIYGGRTDSETPQGAHVRFLVAEDDSWQVRVEPGAAQPGLIRVEEIVFIPLELAQRGRPSSE